MCHDICCVLTNDLLRGYYNWWHVTLQHDVFYHFTNILHHMCVYGACNLAGENASEENLEQDKVETVKLNLADWLILYIFTSSNASSKLTNCTVLTGLMCYCHN